MRPMISSPRVRVCSRHFPPHTLPMLTPAEVLLLRALLSREEVSPATDEEPIRAGDLVQLHPLYDRAFGGMMAVVTQTECYGLRVYLLRPHRGGCREAWLHLHHTDVTRVGRLCWPELSAFARRSDCRLPECPHRMI